MSTIAIVQNILENLHRVSPALVGCDPNFVIRSAGTLISVRLTHFPEEIRREVGAIQHYLYRVVGESAYVAVPMPLSHDERNRWIDYLYNQQHVSTSGVAHMLMIDEEKVRDILCTLHPPVKQLSPA